MCQKNLSLNYAIFLARVIMFFLSKPCFGGDLASTGILKLMMHAEDEAYLVNQALLAITGKSKGLKMAANNRTLARVAVAA
jgi:hypothetical protein